MKKFIKFSYLAMAVFMGVLFWGQDAQAKKDADTISSGVFVEEIDLSGMSRQEAERAVQDYIITLKGKEITFTAVDGNEVKTTPGELGITWKNKDIIKEAAELGTEGNIVKRYKDLKDLEHQNKVYELEFTFDAAAIQEIISEKCAPFNQEAVDAYLTRENGTFKVHDGQTGKKVDETAAVNTVNDYMTDEWELESCSIELPIIVDEPVGKAEDLEKVKDVLGTFETSYTSSGASRSKNVSNGCELVNGTTIYPGEEFSMYDEVKPFSEDNGYYMAGSYLNGQVVDSLGGGICQVSTTLYNAVLLAELDVTQRYSHSMIVSYVKPSSDAAIAESSGKDFKFINNTDYPIYIEGITKDKHISFTIYGVEYRPANREVIYESEVLSENRPETEKIIQDANQPVGYVNVQSAHIGYKAKLWKIVKEDGEIVSKTEVNSSSYAMSPRTATVGVATEDPMTYATIQGAIQSGSIDNVRNVAAAIKAQNQALADLIKAQEAAAAQAQVDQ